MPATPQVLRFNAAEIEQLRGILADLAKETGGRKDIQVLSGDADSPVEVRQESRLDLTKLTEEELEVMERLMERARAGPTREGRSA